MRVVHWLEGGTLLGAVRENGEMLAWEDDVDISGVLDDKMDWDTLATGLVERCRRDGYYIDLFKDKSLVAISYDPPQPWPFRLERTRMRGEIRVDLAFYRRAMNRDMAVLERISPKGAFPRTQSGWYGVPEEVVLPTSSVGFLGRDLACPNQPNEYLRLLYGDFKEVEFTYIDGTAAKTRRSAEASVATDGSDTTPS
jgi:hypothetical protein